MGSLAHEVEPLLQYPKARRDETVVDNYHGVMIPDPYRWLEDPDSPETKEFVENQMKLTESVLITTCEARNKLRESLTKSYDYPKYSAPFRAGEKFFFFHNTGLQPQRVLYIQDNLDEEPEVLLDPNELSEDGTLALSFCKVSEDAKYLAYAISTSGSDWNTIKVMRIEDESFEPDTISWVKFSNISWTHDNKGFFYSRYPSPRDESGKDLDAGKETNANLNQELYYHFLGTDQSQDILCWSDAENPEHRFSTTVTDDGKYVLLYTFKGCDPVNKVHYLDLKTLPQKLEPYRGTDSLLPFVELAAAFDAYYSYIANEDTVFTFITNKDSPRKKIVRVDIRKPFFSWIEVLGEHNKDVLESAVAVNGDRVVLNYLSDVKSVLQLRDLKTGSMIRDLPVDIGSVSCISSRRKDDIFFVEFTSFLVPGIIYMFELKSEAPKMTIFKEITVPGFNKAEFEVRQVFVESKDGSVKIPVFIVARKGILLDGSHPCLLYAYGGFGVSVTPCFGVGRILIAKHLGFVFSVANVRGGGEYGEEWHKEGSLCNKQKCFDDFISAAEFLVSSGYTQPKKLCIEGGSNGGLLIGACINQRPELFGCALAHVGVMDMLRFHKFTIGHAWTSEFGCSDKEEEFHWLIKYSPLHNVGIQRDKSSGEIINYPSTMLLTADHDDRVVPLHSLKFLATMQHLSKENSQRNSNPIVGRIERKAGHGAGKPTHKIIDEAADRYAFMAKMVGAAWTDN